MLELEGIISKKNIEKQFLEKERKVTGFILRNPIIFNYNKMDFLKAFYDNLLLRLTNNNYLISSKLSKRLVCPYTIFLSEK